MIFLKLDPLSGKPLYSRRMKEALKALKTHLPKDMAEAQEPEGGFLLWIRLKHFEGKAIRVYDEFGKAGVTVTPGHFFHLNPPRESCFRLSISAMDDKQITEGIRRIGSALRKVAGSL